MAGRWEAEAADATPLEPHVDLRTRAAVGTRAGLAAGLAMIGVQMLNGEIAASSTPVPGVVSSTWTAITSISAFLLGTGAFSDSFAVVSIAFGLAVHLLLAIALGVVGVAFLVWTLGPRPGPFAALLIGLAYGLFLEVALNLTVNSIDDPNLVYQSTLPWSWWLAHAVYGTILGLVAARRLTLSRAVT